MKTLQKPLNNQEGFILALAMAMLVVLTLIGLSATRTSVTDIKIAGNERRMTQDFYAGDTVWQVGTLWLNTTAASRATESKNKTLVSGDTDAAYDTKEYYKVVRNYGDGDDGHENRTFPGGTQDGTYLTSNFWYRLIVNDSKKAEGSGENVEDFPFDIDTATSGSTKIAVRVFKTLKIGY